MSETTPASPSSPTATRSDVEHSGQHISVLDALGDVVLFRDEEKLWLFRDGHDGGLLVHHQGDQWTLVRPSQPHTSPDTRWGRLCVGGWDAQRGEYVARQLSTGRVIARWDTHYGILARAGRFYLRLPRTREAAA
ncbi:hypothetical protein [Micromonospora sp. SH-82]|uniref:hypothetical protein n=1 Tax=Micromonospora sp. SH-82 TaxID=3132938 RepID=UPI003EB9AD39